MTAQEAGPEWRTVPGFPHYTVNELGEVWSTYRAGLRQMNPWIHDEDGYRKLALRDPSGRVQKFRLHRLVLLAFVGPCPEGQQVRHLDGNPANNALSNLAYGTALENAQDKRRHGTNSSPNRPTKTHCIHGHPFDEANTAFRAGRRDCRACQREYKARRRAGVYADRAGVYADCALCGASVSVHNMRRHQARSRCKETAALLAEVGRA